MNGRPQRVPQVREDTAWEDFRGDVREAARVWRHHPGLPLLTLALVIALEVVFVFGEESDATFFAGTPLMCFVGGFMGTQRIWYQRAFESDRLGAREVWSLSWRFVPRFAVFGFVTGLPSIPMLAFGLISEWARWGALVVSWVLIDVWITFATLALAYTTRSTRSALETGWWFLRSRWADIRWHALVPPLVVILGARTMPVFIESLWPVAAISVAGWMANLLFKGAHARRYLATYKGSPASNV